MTTRRQFIAAAAGLLATPLLDASSLVEIHPTGAEQLQEELFKSMGSGNQVRIGRPTQFTCFVREDGIGNETSRHPLLVPPGVHLDLNGSTLLLDLRSNSYGVRLSSDSSIHNGTIKVVRSEGKGSQACWHSGICTGAAYGDGGTPDKPGFFSVVKNWMIENITIDQPFEAAAIQLMSEACHGVIRNVTILDSAKALLGIGMDWGSVGPMMTADEEIPRMRKLWEAGQIYSTHPHDILMDNIRVGRLTRNLDGNDAGIRCSACHNITIRNLKIQEAGVAVAIWGGDLGYEFARNDLRNLEHSGYLLENIHIQQALLFGLVLNGSADNIVRAQRSHGYDAVRDPVHPGVNKPVLRNITLQGSGSRPNRQGIYALAVTDALFEDIEITDFGIGVHAEDWVRGMKFTRTKLERNQKDLAIEGTREPATGVVIEST